MIQQQTDAYIKVCMKSWLLCESCVHAEMNSKNPRYDLINECMACAKACFAVVSRLVSNADDMQDLPFNCLLHCRQCVNECQKYYYDNDIRLCGEVCSICAETVKELAVFSPN